LQTLSINCSPSSRCSPTVTGTLPALFLVFGWQVIVSTSATPSGRPTARRSCNPRPSGKTHPSV
jgi:hypothetical protein